jgi:hypothetical protein
MVGNSVAFRMRNFGGRQLDAAIHLYRVEVDYLGVVFKSKPYREVAFTRCGRPHDNRYHHDSDGNKEKKRRSIQRLKA